MTDTRGRAGSVAALRYTNFRLYFGGQLLSTLGTWMQITAQLWLVLELTESGAALGRLSALQFLPSLVLGAWAGTLADKVDNRYLLMTTNTVGGAFALLLGLLSASGNITVGWLYVAAVGVGLGNAFDRAAGPAFVTSLVPERHLGSAIGLYSVTTSASRMVGIAVAGVVLAAWGATACFLVNSASYLIVLAGLAALDKTGITDRRDGSGPVRIRDGLAHVRSRPILFRTLATTTGVGMIGMNFMILVPAMVNLTFDAGSTWFGVAEVFSGAGSTTAGFAVGLLARPTARSVGLAAVALGVSTIVTGLSPWLVMFCVMMFVVGLTATGFMTTSMTVTQANSQPSMRGRVSALQVVANSGVMPLGSLAAGALMSTMGVRETMVLTGSSSLAVGLVLLFVESVSPTPLWAEEQTPEADSSPAR